MVQDFVIKILRGINQITRRVLLFSQLTKFNFQLNTLRNRLISC